MALFGKNKKTAGPQKKAAPRKDIRPVMGRKSHCSVCDTAKPFSRCWLRAEGQAQCQCCGAQFESPAHLYKQQVPACPKCGEYLEHPGFEYGLCDGCGSKFEMMAGTKASLIPNQQQRIERDKVGKARIPKR